MLESKIICQSLFIVQKFLLVVQAASFRLATSDLILGGKICMVRLNDRVILHVGVAALSLVHNDTLAPALHRIALHRNITL